MNTEYKLMAREWWNGAIWTQRHASGYEEQECREGTPSAECRKYLDKYVIFTEPAIAKKMWCKKLCPRTKININININTNTNTKIRKREKCWKLFCQERSSDFTST